MPEPTMTAVGAASPTAQGQAMTSTLMPAAEGLMIKITSASVQSLAGHMIEHPVLRARVLIAQILKTSSADCNKVRTKEQCKHEVVAVVRLPAAREGVGDAWESSAGSIIKSSNENRCQAAYIVYERCYVYQGLSSSHNSSHSAPSGSHRRHESKHRA